MTAEEGTGKAAEESQQVEELDELATVTRERDEYLDQLLRLKAEFDNYRKREARLQSERAQFAAERLVKELLPVLDDLERALDAAERHVHRALRDSLVKEGLEEIETCGRFDPHVHEALLSQPSPAEEGSVIEVVQKGYRLGDRVLRPARVVVAAAAPEGSAGGDGNG